MKKPTRQKPGPLPTLVGSWNNCPEFFDRGVQNALRRLRAACDKAGDPPGSALLAFKAVNRVSKIDHWRGVSELGRELSFGFFAPNFESNGEQDITQRWLEAGSLYSDQPVAISELLLSLSQFHENPPRMWPIGSQLMFITTLRNPGKAGRLRSSELVEMVRRLFGTHTTEQAIRMALTREVRARARVFKRWYPEIQGVARLQTASFIERLRKRD
jgi:hypothetical protein